MSGFPSGMQGTVAAAGAALVMLALIAGVVVAALQAGIDPLSLKTHDIEAFVAGWGMWSIAASLLLMVLHSFVPVPAEVIAVANGMLFGTAGGAAVTWSGAMLGAISAFALARWLGRPFVCRVLAEPARRRLETLACSGDTLLMMRLIPLISFNLVNYAAGLAGTGWWIFLWTTAVGILPLTVLTAALGARMLHLPWWIWLALAAIVVALWLAYRASIARRR